MTIDTPSYDAPSDLRRGETNGSFGTAPFRFAPTFVIDLVFSWVYVVLFLRTWTGADHRPWVCAIAGFFGLLLVFCYAGKVAIIGYFNRCGGDARTYVISSRLVTTGPYAFSRNPVYLQTLIQCVVWTALIAFLQYFAPCASPVFAFSILLPFAFFLVTDICIRREEIALKAMHASAFAAYAKSVNRWFGRKRARGAGWRISALALYHAPLALLPTAAFASVTVLALSSASALTLSEPSPETIVSGQIDNVHWRSGSAEHQWRWRAGGDYCRSGYYSHPHCQ
jgi:protein-S-isoprenylcysteine O-methyltransferase Ste14